jgi:hypothetical protein
MAPPARIAMAADSLRHAGFIEVAGGVSSAFTACFNRWQNSIRHGSIGENYCMAAG